MCQKLTYINLLKKIWEEEQVIQQKNIMKYYDKKQSSKCIVNESANNGCMDEQCLKIFCC